VPLSSPFYVVRPTDAEFYAAIARRDSIVLVKGPAQVGKTSLLARGLQRAREGGARVLLTDLEMLNAAHLESAAAFLLALARTIAEQLDLETGALECWDCAQGPNLNFQGFLRRTVLEAAPTAIVWGLDSVDRLFGRDFGSEVFGLFRSWHNARSLAPAVPWSRLTLAMAYSTEAHLLIADPNLSPFNVGTRLALCDFTPEQVADLNRRHGSPLKDAAELARFYGVVGGHPYLVRRGLYELAGRGVGIAAFVERAAGEEGIYGAHLRRILSLLAREPALGDAVAGVLAGGPSPAPEVFYRLRSAGVLAGESERAPRMRCPLYATYLAPRLR
jgi:hypothetical protein